MVAAIQQILLTKGLEMFVGKRPPLVKFSEDELADLLLNDLQNCPHAFVIACLMDRQITAERAWRIPIRFAERVGTFDMSVLRAMSQDEYRKHMLQPEPLHIYSNDMARNFYEAIRLIVSKYDGNAAKIWEGRPSSSEVVFRFLEFRGIGSKIATMAANILARDFKMPFADYYSIDISVDVHVRRVFERLGLVSEGSCPEAFIYQARSLSPEFPGLLDLPTWQIGRQWCRPSNPICQNCYMRAVCPTAGGRMEIQDDRTGVGEE